MSDDTLDEIYNLAELIAGCWNSMSPPSSFSHLAKAIIEDGYVKVVPVQLEVLTTSEMLDTLNFIKFTPAFEDELKRISKATIDKSGKVQLYRRVE